MDFRESGKRRFSYVYHCTIRNNNLTIKVSANFRPHLDNQKIHSIKTMTF